MLFRSPTDRQPLTDRSCLPRVPYPCAARPGAHVHHCRCQLFSTLEALIVSRWAHSVSSFALASVERQPPTPHRRLLHLPCTEPVLDAVLLCFHFPAPYATCHLHGRVAGAPEARRAAAGCPAPSGRRQPAGQRDQPRRQLHPVKRAYQSVLTAPEGRWGERLSVPPASVALRRRWAAWALLLQGSAA